MGRQAAIAFAGTPRFAVPALQALLDDGYDVSLVLTQPDRPAGRGRRVATSAVKQLAAARGLNVHQPENLSRGPGQVAPWGPPPELLVAVAYGLLLPRWMLDWPRVAAVNVHASLLPRWRGAAPIQHAILAGDARTGVSIMKMEVGLDSGPVYTQEALKIGAAETAGELHDRLADLGARLLLGALPAILDGTLEPIPQDESAATHAPKIDKRHARLDWRRCAAALARQVRAFNPWPVAEAYLDDGRALRIWEAQAVEALAAAEPGTIAAAHPRGIDVATAKGVLRIERLQPPGSRAMSARAYLNAHQLEGARFVS